MSNATLDIRRSQGPHGAAVAEVWLNRPEVRNAFNDGVITELTAAFRELGADPALRAIVLGGHGKAFCAGADLSWMKAMAGFSWQDNQADAARLADMLWTLYSCPVPIVGRIQGDCYAGGMGLAAVCDVLVVAQGAHFCLSEARLGLLPATIAPYVVRALGEQVSRRYFVTAERFEADFAAKIGLIHHEVEDEMAMEKLVEHYADLAYAASPEAVADTKDLVSRVTGEIIDSSLGHLTAKRLAHRRVSTLGKEGLSAFLEKRKPSRAR